MTGLENTAENFVYYLFFVQDGGFGILRRAMSGEAFLHRVSRMLAAGTELFLEYYAEASIFVSEERALRSSPAVFPDNVWSNFL